ncbi:signal recognition particle-docking protein FtsY [Peptoniphilaceae bacterium SGI.131]
MFKKIFGIKDKKEEKTIEEVKIQESKPIEREISQGYIHEPVIAQAEIEKPQIHEPVMGEAEIEKPQIYESVTGEVKIQEPEKKRGFFERLKDGLLKTRNAMSSSIDNLINGKAKIDDDLYDELEEILISADMGVDSTVMMIEKLRDTIEEKHIRDPKFIKEELVTIMKAHLLENNINNDLNIEVGKQTVILVIGVNGVGKTTTIGKLAKKLENDGLSVMLAAADTFRAAAIEQLTEWANRAGVDIVSHSEGADPASVVFDAISSQKAKNKDVLIIDTAGRLHNKKNLMNELEKINRIIDREHPGANREALLVLDATTGQNAVYQAKEFSKVTGISGIVLTKLDGTAKGGVVFPLQADHKIPVKYIGIGEGIDNLEKFEAEKFVDAIMNIG